MSPELVDALIAKLKAANVTAVNYGVVQLAERRSRVAQGLRVRQEDGPGDDRLRAAAGCVPLIDKLANEYNINVAIHDHPKPSHYWNPEAVLKVCEGRSKRIGACADVGHWARSGLDAGGMHEEARRPDHFACT